MAKEIVRIAKLEFNGGQAKPGPELAGLGINMPSFTKDFNDQTKDRNGEPVPVVITVYKDKSFTFIPKTTTTSYKLLQATNLKKGSPNSKTTIVGQITLEQLKEIAKYKLPDLNTDNIEAAMNQIAGTARNMGILIKGRDNIEQIKKEAQEAVEAEKQAQAKEAALEEAAAQAAKKDKPLEVKTIDDEQKEQTEQSEEDNKNDEEADK